MDAKLASNFLRREEFSWGDLILKSLYRNELPQDFPLRSATQKSLYWPEEFFLTDWNRWNAESGAP
jgi:hypothetical protein